MSRQLIEAVLKWWEEHQHDTVASEEDEWNVYDEPPEFVQLALASQPAEQPRTFDRTIETPRRKQAVEKLLSLGWTYHHERGWIEPAEQARGEVVTFILDGVPVQIQGDRESLNLLMERIDETSDHVGNFAQPKHEQAVGDGVVTLADAEGVAQMAYIAGKRGYTFDGFVSELRAASTQRPAVATPAEDDELRAAVRSLLPIARKGFDGDTSDQITFGRAVARVEAALCAPRPAVATHLKRSLSDKGPFDYIEPELQSRVVPTAQTSATPAEVTDEMVERLTGELFKDSIAYHHALMNPHTSKPFWRKAIAAALASPSAGAVVPDGWKVVPLTLTDAMREAWMEAACTADAEWADLLAAAPELKP